MRTTPDGTYVTVTPSPALRQSPNFDTKWAKAAFVALLNAAGVTGSYTVRAQAGIPGSPAKAQQIRFKLKQGKGAGRPILAVNWQSGHNGTAFEGQLTGSSIDTVDINEQLLLAHPHGVYTYRPEKPKAFEPDAAAVEDIALELCTLAGSRADRAVENTGLSKLESRLGLAAAGYDLCDLLRWLVKGGYALAAPAPELFAYIEPSLFRIIDPTYGTDKPVAEAPVGAKPVVGAIGILQELKTLRETANRHRQLLERIGVLEERGRAALETCDAIVEQQKELAGRLVEARQAAKQVEAELHECNARVKDPEMLAAVEALAEFETLFRAGT